MSRRTKKDTTVQVHCPNCGALTDWDRIQTFGICDDCVDEADYEAELVERSKLNDFERSRGVNSN